MADHNKPTLTSAYADFLTELDARIDDAAVGFDPAVTTVTNAPNNTIRFSSAAGKWQKYNGSTWNDLATTYAISISGNAGTVTNGVVTTGSYADPAWITSLSGTKIAGAISGNAASATVLQTARTINGVSFNGSANISINLNNNLTFNNGGSGAASGVAFSGGTAATISYNTIGAPSTTGAGASGTWGISISGNAATATTAGACTGNAATATVADSCTGNAATANYATTAGNGGVTSVNGATGAVTVNSIGQGQSWQVVTASRALNTTYTNSTGRPIQVICAARAQATNHVRGVVDGVTIVDSTTIDCCGVPQYSYFPLSFIVPAGSTYRIEGSWDFLTWSELR